MKNTKVWSVEWSTKARKRFSKLDHKAQKEIQKFINTQLVIEENPRVLGEPMTGAFKGTWRFRVGDYRIITEVYDNELVIVVVKAGHRKNVYDVH